MNNITFYIYLPLGLMFFLISVLAFKFSLLERFIIFFNSLFGRGISLLANPELGFGNIVESIPYRDFWAEGVVETDKYIWAGLEFKPIPTDHFTGGEWNSLGERLSRVLVGLDDETILQFYCKVNTDVSDAFEVIAKQVRETKHRGLQQIGLSQIKYLEEHSQAGHIQREKRYLLVGIPLAENRIMATLKGYLSKQFYTDIESIHFKERFNELLRIRETVWKQLTGLEMDCSAIPVKELYDEIHSRLNPSKSNQTEVYFPSITGESVESLEIKAANLASKGMEYFSDSPRETLVSEDIENHNGYLQIGDKFVLTLSMLKQNLQSFAGLSQSLLRSSSMGFPYSISTSFLIGRQTSWDDKLEKMQGKAEDSINASAKQGRSNVNQSIKRTDILGIRKAVRSSSNKVGEVSFQITIEADSKEELFKRRDDLIAACRKMEGMEITAERHVLPSQFFSSLPCGDIDKDFRKKPSLASHIVGLFGFTGADEGVPLSEATDVFRRSDNGLFFWNPFASTFQSGMSIICGGAGSGKSGLTNRQTIWWLLSGRKVVSFDFGGSSYRICKAMGGNFIRIGKNSNVGLGLFDVFAKDGEFYEEGELNEYKIPVEGIRFVTRVLEVLCLDPKKQDTSLPPTYTKFILDKVTRLYNNRAMSQMIPTLEDFLAEFANCRRDDLDVSKAIIGSLQIYGADSAYGTMLNDRSEALQADSHYTVFDFTETNKDDRTRLIAALGAGRFLERFLRRNRKSLKGFIVDELHQLNKSPIIRTLIDDYFRTARKQKVLCCAISQDPEDFTAKELAGIRASMETKFLFKHTKLSLMQEAFELNSGMMGVLEHIAKTVSREYSECLLIYPGGNVARLKLHLNPVEQRLCLGAGREKMSSERSIQYLKSVLKNIAIDDDLLAGLQEESAMGE